MNIKMDLKWLLLATICLLICACQTLQDEDEVPQTNEMTTLQIQTRSAENVALVYPLYIYVFSMDGSYVVSQVIEQDSDAIQLTLSTGSYRVVAVSGVSEDYTLPEHPTLDEVITLNGNKGASTPLMIGKADVTINSKMETTLNIVLSYVVSAVDVTLENIPDDVSAISLVLSPFYSSLSMNGEYQMGGQTMEMVCSLNEENVWTTGTRYVFPGSASQTVISIILEKEDGTSETYGYTYQGSLLANHPFHVHGSYSDGVTIGGDVVIEGWGEAVEVYFEFGASVVPDEDMSEDVEPDLSGLPEIGSIWNGAIVASISEADESGVDLLLLSLDEWDITTAQVEELTDSYVVNGISEWRLPEYEEAQLLRNTYSGDNRTALNERIAAYDSDLLGIDGEERYLCNKEGTYYSFIFAGGTTISKAGTKRTYYTRLVNTYHITL